MGCQENAYLDNKTDRPDWMRYAALDAVRAYACCGNGASVSMSSASISIAGMDIGGVSGLEADRGCDLSGLFSAVLNLFYWTNPATFRNTVRRGIPPFSGCNPPVC